MKPSTHSIGTLLTIALTLIGSGCAQSAPIKVVTVLGQPASSITRAFPQAKPSANGTYVIDQKPDRLTFLTANGIVTACEVRSEEARKDWHLAFKKLGLSTQGVKPVKQEDGFHLGPVSGLPEGVVVVWQKSASQLVFGKGAQPQPEVPTTDTAHGGAFNISTVWGKNLKEVIAVLGEPVKPAKLEQLRRPNWIKDVDNVHIEYRNVKGFSLVVLDLSCHAGQVPLVLGFSGVLLPGTAIQNAPSLIGLKVSSKGEASQSYGATWFGKFKTALEFQGKFAGSGDKPFERQLPSPYGASVQVLKITGPAKGNGVKAGDHVLRIYADL